MMLFDITQEITHDFAPFVTRKTYKNEFVLARTVKNDRKAHPASEKKVMEWLEIWRILASDLLLETPILKSYDANAASAVEKLQDAFGVAVTGEVDAAFFDLLTRPLAKAFGKSDNDLGSVREAILEYAHRHMECFPLETSDKTNNQGPWARAYLNLNATEADDEWCAGFVCTILDQAFSHFDEDFRDYIYRSGWVPNIVNDAIKRKQFIAHNKIAGRYDEVQAGDIFVEYRPDNKYWKGYSTPVDLRYIHIGLISAIEGSVITTIEGNKNFDETVLQYAEERYGGSMLPDNRGGVFSRTFDLSLPENTIGVFKLSV